MEEQLNLKKLVKKVSEVKTYLLTKWKVIAIVCLIGTSIGVLIGKTSETTYIGDTNFMISSSKGGGKLGSLLGMASQLGVLGGSGSSMTVENVSEIIVSDRIILNALLKPLEIRHNDDCLGNFFIDEFGIRDGWKEAGLDSRFTDFQFTGRKAFNLKAIEDSVARKIIGKVKGMVVVNYEKQSGIISLTVESVNEKFSYYLTNTLLDELTTFYVDQATESERSTFSILKNKNDSIKEALMELESQLSQLQDNSFKTVRPSGKLDEMRLGREVGILNVMYSSSVTNLEMARVSLLQKKPYIQVIDEPILPLKLRRKSYIMYGIMFLILFGFGSIFYFVIQHEVQLSLIEE